MPGFSDVEVIALSLAAEWLSIDSENYLFSKLNSEYRKEFENIIVGSKEEYELLATAREAMNFDDEE